MLPIFGKFASIEHIIIDLLQEEIFTLRFSNSPLREQRFQIFNDSKNKSSTFPIFPNEKDTSQFRPYFSAFNLSLAQEKFDPSLSKKFGDDEYGMKKYVIAFLYRGTG